MELENVAQRVVAFRGKWELPLLEVAQAELRRDKFVLFEDIGLQQADVIMSSIASSFGLSEALEMQAGLASYSGLRRNIGDNFMTVNRRREGQFITPHSEGDATSNIQLSSFYCLENSVKGGESVFLNVDPAGSGWFRVKELRKRTIGSSALVETSESSAAFDGSQPIGGGRSGCNELIIKEYDVDASTRVQEVLTPSRRSHSVISERDLPVYWDSIGSVDFDCVREFTKLLTDHALLPADLVANCDMDSEAARRVWSSGVSFAELFRSCMLLKLRPGQLILFNNLSWAHAVNRWEPGSGRREVIAAFA